MTIHRWILYPFLLKNNKLCEFNKNMPLIIFEDDMHPNKYYKSQVNVQKLALKLQNTIKWHKSVY